MKFRAIHGTLLLGVALLGACRIPDTPIGGIPSPRPNDPASQEAFELAKLRAVQTNPALPYTTVSFHKFGNAFLPAQRVVNRPEEAYLEICPSGRAPLPPIDYATQTGILVSFGDQYTGMLDAEILAIEDSGPSLAVHTVRWDPKGGSADVGTPVHYVAIARTDKPVMFTPTITAPPSARVRALPAFTIAPTPWPSATPNGEQAAEVERLYSLPSVPFTTIFGDHVSYLHDLPAMEEVFQTQAEEDAWFKRHPSDRRVQTDYTTSTTLLKAFGPQGTGMIRGDIVAVEDRGEKLVVHAILWVPPPAATVTADMGYPYRMVRIAKSDKPIEFAPVVKADRRLRTKEPGSQ